MKLLTTIPLTVLLLPTGTHTTKTVRFSDGDTLTVLTENKEQTRTRLEGMDRNKLPENRRKPDLYIGNMARLNELENSAKDLGQCLIELKN
jgi:endonuclease YncB( thermonuclease family)